MIRKNISLYDEDVKKIERIVEKHEGNLSAAIREIIEFTHVMQRKFGSLEEAKRVERRIKGICIPNMMLNWFLRYTTECLPDEIAIGSLEEIHALESVSDLADIADIGFAADINVDADDDRNPTEATIEVSGERMQAEFVAKLAACFLAENKGLVVEDVSRRAASITVKLKSRGERESEANYKMMRESLITHFGERHVMMQEIAHKPRFWNEIVNTTIEWDAAQRYKYPKIYR
ncbi:MAG: hypothetical protein QMD22_08625 [archaeon]|nr:hypothetical protein [archaeon]